MRIVHNSCTWFKGATFQIAGADADTPHCILLSIFVSY